MKYSSTKAFNFYADNLTNKKYHSISLKINRILTLKNNISKAIFNNPMDFIDKSKFEIVQYFRSEVQNEYNNDDLLNGMDIQKAIEDVAIDYSNRFKALNFSTKLVKKIKYTKYKIGPKKGQVKDIKISRYSTNLTSTITYLSRTGHTKENIVYIMENMELKKEVKDFYGRVLVHIEKYKDRLFNLVRSKQRRLLRNLKKPIVYKNETYRSIQQIKHPVLKKNKNKKSVVQGFITLDFGNEYTKLHIPVKLSSFYGNIDDFSKKYVEYYIKKEKSGRLRIILTKPCERETIEHNETNKVLGVDLNVKNNMFSLSTGDTIDYDRKIVDEHIKILKKLDKRKNKSLNKRRQQIKDKATRRLQSHIKERCSTLVQYAIDNGFNTISLENINLITESSFIKNEELDTKYTRLSRTLGLTSIKDIVKSIAYKKGISVVLVHPEYTSQQCSSCFYTDKNNRKTQEKFKCIKCNNELNADLNSSINIRNRVTDTRLSKFLKKTNLKELVPKELRLSDIKNALYEIHYKEYNLN